MPIGGGCIFSWRLVQVWKEECKIYWSVRGAKREGGNGRGGIRKYFRNCILPLFPDALDLPGFCIMVKVDSGPGRLNVNLLAKLRLLGFCLYPGVSKNTTAVTQETD